MDNHYGYHTNHPLLKLLNLGDKLLTFKHAGEETILEMWLRFKAILQTCSSHEMPNKTYWIAFIGVSNPKIKA